MRELKSYPRGKCDLSTGYPLFDKEILKTVEKSVTPWRKTYGPKK